MLRISLLDRATLGDTSLDPIAALGALTCYDTTSPDEVEARIADAEVIITNKNIYRPGLPLAGFFNHFEASRIQIIGKTEFNYIEQMNSAVREKRLTDFLERINLSIDAGTFFVTKINPQKVIRVLIKIETTKSPKSVISIIFNIISPFFLILLILILSVNVYF